MSDIISKLSSLSSAEDIFAELDVAYDPKALAVARLHVLKRLSGMLDSACRAELSEAERRAFLKASLQSAYAEFATKPPIDARLFKVLRDRDPNSPQPRGAFVPLSQLVGDSA